MNNAIHTLSIEHFKSIRSMRLDCKRINVFVGAPNVGKSNILEALALMGLTENHAAGGLKDFVRFETFANLFYDNRRSEICTVSANEFTYQLRYDAYSNRYLWFLGDTERMRVTMPEVEEKLSGNFALSNTIDFFQKSLLDSDTLQRHDLVQPAVAIFEHGVHMSLANTYPARIRKYMFPTQGDFTHSFNEYLLPVFGRNLFSVLDNHQDLLRLVAPLFKRYGLKLMFDDDNRYVLVKTIGDSLKKYPFSLIADTLQRVIFYLAAIHTNQDSVLILEEPEAHLHAAYIRDLAANIVEAERNQFFFSTHSPYLLEYLMEHTPADDLAVFAVFFDTEEYATTARQLTHDEIRDIVSYGTDIFFNIERYTVSEVAFNGNEESIEATVAA